MFEAQAFAENARSTIKQRGDEIALDLRTHWLANRADFTRIVQLRQSYTRDIAFQVAIIGATAMLYSNLATSSDRVYLGEREHFRVHQASADATGCSSANPCWARSRDAGRSSSRDPIIEAGAFAGVIASSR